MQLFIPEQRMDLRSIPCLLVDKLKRQKCLGIPPIPDFLYLQKIYMARLKRKERLQTK